jgi:hypothetical protein
MDAAACGHMIRAPRSDFWRVAVADRPITDFMQPECLPPGGGAVAWLPDPGPWRYLADPFGLRRDGRTHIFVEAYDYRTKHAVIEHHELDAALVWQGKSTALARPVHLSYPFIVEHHGEVFMIPESSRANEVALYRARRFPRDWVRELALLPRMPAAESSVLQHQGRWWMFFTLVGPGQRDQRELHVAHAAQLTGPWQLHPRNPVLTDRRGARPGGTPFVDARGRVVLPVQDCGDTYGGAVRFVAFAQLTPDDITIERPEARLTGGLFSLTHTDGCHTLAACGNLTLVDVKRTVQSWARHGINLRRHLRGLLPGS